MNPYKIIMDKLNPKADWFFNKKTKWQIEYSALRSIILQTDLTEELKWGCPCYTINGKNVLLIHGFEEYCAILFHKGVLLNDKSNLLIQQTERVQSARQLRFKSLNEIKKLERKIITYIKEAIKIEKTGAKAEMKKTADYKVPIEFKNILNEMPELKKAFDMLTPGRQRGYILYFSSAKQAKTRESRIEKYISKILSGKGLDDKKA
jgi:uncharacterized protein YdeI (YjbR/CyaY-like superfamily)